MAKIPGYVYLAGLGGAALAIYYLHKKKKFPFNEGSIVDELKNDLSDMTPEQQTSQGAGSGISPGTVQSNPSAVDYGLYQNYLQGLKTAFPDYTPNLASGQGGAVIAGDPNLFQNNNFPGGPPIQPYPGGALMPPFTQQRHPYYRPPMRGPMPYPMPYPRPRPWDDPWFEFDFGGRKRRKWDKPKPTASTPSGGISIGGGGINVGPISIGPGGIKVGDLISIGAGGINVKDLVSIGSGGINVSGSGSLSGLGNSIGGNLGDLLKKYGTNATVPGSANSVAEVKNGIVLLNKKPVTAAPIKTNMLSSMMPSMGSIGGMTTGTGGNVQGMLNDVFSKSGLFKF